MWIKYKAPRKVKITETKLEMAKMKDGYHNRIGGRIESSVSES